MKKFKLNISLHSLYRYMERVMGFDFTEMKVEYSLHHNLPSINHVKDSLLIKWVIDRGMDFSDVSGVLKSRIHNLMTPTQKNIYLNNNNRFYEKIVDEENDVVYVIRENTLVTILD